jgi:hypothetical protein
MTGIHIARFDLFGIHLNDVRGIHLNETIYFIALTPEV